MNSASLRGNIDRVRKRIADAALRAGRDPAEVILVAISKMQPLPVIVAAYEAGIRLFGENRVEEAGPKANAATALIAAGPPPAWHMVGHLQSRKTDSLLPWAAMLHSLDSTRLAVRLDRAVRAHAEAAGNLAVDPFPVLLEVNVAGEPGKYGFTSADLPAAVEAIAALPGLRIEGLMTMAPLVADPELTRPVFVGLREVRDDLARRYPRLSWQQMSMGMSNDFEVAIEEGATLVRIGRAIFGERIGETG